MRGLLRPLLAAVVGTLAAPAAVAQGFSEGFDNVAGLSAAGWVFVQRTPNPRPAGAWRQGGDTDGGAATAAFAPQAGAAGSYLRSDYTQTTATAPVTVSDWAILPARTLNNGDTLSFYTRTNDGGAYPERLVVRLSLNGTSTNVGASEATVGDFTTVLADLNPSLATGDAGYPTTWTQYTVNLSGLSGPTLGRFAFQRLVMNSGPNGLNGNQLGLDTLVYVPVPEPAGLLLVGGLLLVVRRRLVGVGGGSALGSAEPSPRG